MADDLPINHTDGQWRTRRGGHRSPRLEKCRANSVFRASTSCTKILNVKSIFNTVKNLRIHSVF